MINFFRRYTFNQYLSFLSIILFSISCIYSINENFNEASVLRDVSYNILAIAFCVICIIKGKTDNCGERILSWILLTMGIIELLSIKESVFLMVPLFYIFSFLTLKKRIKSNIITIVLGIVNITWCSAFMTSREIGLGYNFLYTIVSARYLFFILLIFLIIYEISVESSIQKQSKELPISTQLNELKELLDEEYITREEFDIMKNSMINIHEI